MPKPAGYCVVKDTVTNLRREADVLAGHGYDDEVARLRRLATEVEDKNEAKATCNAEEPQWARGRCKRIAGHEPPHKNDGGETWRDDDA